MLTLEASFSIAAPHARLAALEPSPVSSGGRLVAVREPSPAEQEFLAHLPFIERAASHVARSNHLSAEDAEDFLSCVKVKLIENDYGVLRKFEGRSSLRTFLGVVIQREFIEFQRQRWGKWHPSAEARRGGPVLELLERLLVRDGHTLDEAHELLTSKHRVPLERAEVEALAVRLPVRYVRRFESDEALPLLPSTDPPPDVALERIERERLGARVRDVVSGLKTRLPETDRLILAYRFEDGRKVVEIADILHLDQKALYRRVESLLKQLREALEAEGFDAGFVRALFDEPT
jgi:RNA polymerase sigma factor (sigma-70 family)